MIPVPGLFRGVIADSGSVLTPWALYPPGKGTSSAFELGTHLNINTEDPSELIAGLRKATAEELVQATNLLQVRIIEHNYRIFM